MAFRHGVYTREIPTALVAPVQTEAGLPVVVGTAPLHLAGDTDALKNVNEPKLIYDYSEAVNYFGFSDDWNNYTLCEFIYSQFALFGVAPCVLINVLDPSRHNVKINEKEIEIIDGSVNLGSNALKSTVEAFYLNDDDEKIAYELDKDYTLTYGEDEILWLDVVDGGALVGKTSVFVSYTRLAPELVTADDIIGGVDASTGKSKGLELVNSVFPKFRLTPGIIAAPKWSERPGVAAVMSAKCVDINGVFQAISVADIPSGDNGVKIYTNVPEWKNQNNYVDKNQVVCWPLIELDGKIFHISTQLIGLMNSIDAANGDIPFNSPSNHNLQMNACVNGLGYEINLGLDQANYLNGQGIVTALNFQGGWRAWGNRTAIYPANTDPKDNFIPIRRMFNWIRNEFTLTFWQKVDAPMTARLIRTIVNSFNIRLNGLQAIEAILGGEIVFNSSENPSTALMDGKLTFHIRFTPPSPAEQIEGVFEYEPEYLNALFTAIK
ncbi:MAG: phage tail sheath family protein [Synergistaceae bacterium]|nr:phage tail sheath family protein [Synergistaceae bacterium]MBR0075137.1 phage tail sheath family protein [Synergistaceae bacterium]